MADRPTPTPPLAADGPVSYAIVQLAKAHKAVAGALYREVGLHPGQELLLMQLAERDHRTQAELVAALNLDHSTVARMASRLEAQGVVRRGPSVRDRRAVVVSLTDHGRALGADVRRIWAELEAHTVRGLGEVDRAELLRLLRLATAAVTGAD